MTITTITEDRRYYNPNTGTPWGSHIQDETAMHNVEQLTLWLTLCQEVTDTFLAKPIRSRLTQENIGVCTAVYHIQPGTFSRLLVSHPDTGYSQVVSIRLVEVEPMEERGTETERGRRERWAQTLGCSECYAALIDAPDGEEAPRFYHPNTDAPVCYDCWIEVMGPSDDLGDYADARRDR